MKAGLKRFWRNVRQRLTWQYIWESRYRHAAAWLTYLLVLWFAGGDPYLAGFVALVLLIGANRLVARYMRELNARIEAKEGFVWDVEVNEVKVGSISDSTYAQIRHRVFSDERVYVAQGLNLLRVAVNFFDYCYRAIPIGLFWIGVALTLFSPETFSSVLATLQGITAESINRAVSTAGSILTLAMILSVALHWMFGLSRFGFINRFDEAIGTAVRKHCGVAAEGAMVLSRIADGMPMFSDEMDFLPRERKH